jgi:hypothetical protein
MKEVRHGENNASTGKGCVRQDNSLKVYKFEYISQEHGSCHVLERERNLLFLLNYLANEASF